MLVNAAILNDLCSLAPVVEAFLEVSEDVAHNHCRLIISEPIGLRLRTPN
jgi:hypothetical protein